MVDLSKLESEQVELKVENEYRRLKKNAYQREYYSKTVDENKRLKQNAYNRKWYAKNKRSKRMIANANQEQAARKVENKRPRTRAASEGQCEGARCIRGAVRRGALHLMAPVAVAPPPLRFSFQPLAGHKVRRGCGAQSPARKKRRIGCGAQSLARQKAIIDKGALRPVSKKARPELQGSLLHARGLAAQTQPLARPRAAEGGQGFCLRYDVQQNRKGYEA